MKKVLSVLLACIIALSVGMTIASADDVTLAYYVTADPDSTQITVVPVEGTNYVKAGDTFRFTIEVKGSYAFDQTTVVRVFATDHLTDATMGEETEYGYYVYPDADGVYTIPSVDCDLYVKVYNLNSGSIASVKDFVMNLFQFFLNLINWFFGLK